jgi:hypothetical protein
MKGTHALGSIAAIIWAILIPVGIRGVGAARSQHIAGWPSSGQIFYYVYAPVIMLALIVLAWALAVRCLRIKVFTITFIVLALLVLPVYLLVYTGGV